MDFIDITWAAFKEEVAKQFPVSKKFIYRGQSNSDWPLTTKIHRTGLVQNLDDIKLYFDQVIPIVHESVAAWEGRIRNLSDPFELAQFLAYLQHNTFPTPLLDWTYSPYIAAYFAFDGVDHFSPENDNVCIYCFDKEAWLTTYKQSYDYKDEDVHVSILEPSFVGNPKQLLQQGLYMYTNLIDIEGHIEAHQKETDTFLRKYRLSSQERSIALKELSLMNITSMQLFPSLESVCKKVATDISLLFPMGKTRKQIDIEKLKEALENLRNTEKED